MAQQQQNTEYGGYDIDSPQDVYDSQTTEYDREQQSPNATVRAMSNIRAGITGMFGGGPSMNKAKVVQNQMKEIMQDANAQAAPDEDPLTTQMRIAHAIATKMAPVDPGIAMQGNQQMIKLQQAKSQQEALQTKTSLEKVQAGEGSLKLAQGQANANYTVFDAGADDDGIPSMKSYGTPISMYGADGALDPKFHEKMAQAVKDAQEAGAKNPMYLPSDAYLNGKGMTADTRAKAQIAVADAKLQAQLDKSGADGLDVQGIKEAIGQHLFNGPAGLRNIGKANAVAVLNMEGKLGLSPMDGLLAQTEIKGINAAAGAEGRRMGNIGLLSKSIPGLGQNVLDALDGVTRTRFPALNQGIILGKSAAGDAGERRYAASIQSFVQDYARVVSGATGVTSDAARDQAHELLQKSDSPAAIKATIEFLRDKELGVINAAGPAALEALANVKNYPHANKIIAALGMGVLPGLDPTMYTPNPQLPPSDYGVATGKADGATGTIKGPDGKSIKVVVKGGRLVGAT